jgi:putative acetyltransferase
MILRVEEPADAAAVREVVCAAFGGDAEARLVERLRAEGLARLSLVAAEPEIVGHVLFSEIRAGGRPALALAPLAVRPDRQRRGIGSGLVRRALDALRADGHGAVFVVGDPAYYGRFGFSGELARRFACRYAGPAFQALELHGGALDGDAGDVVYPAAFEGV